ncbi:MAG TPA: hypothetical protein HA349_01690 [Methanotrichaceae archaeon]|nr:hypothetical protein [Methanotrichaceae archaeon]
MRRKPIFALLVLATLAIPAVADEVDDLVANLEYGDLDVRWKAAEALGEIGDSRAFDPLIESLKDDEDSRVRKGAAWALGLIGDPKAVDPLIEALQDDYGSARAGAAEALGRIGDPRAVEPLIALLYEEGSQSADPDPQVRANAAWALGEIGDFRATDVLYYWGVLKNKIACEATCSPGNTKQPYDANVQKAAKEAHSKIMNNFESLTSGLNHELYWVRADAAESLGKSGDPQAVDPLIEALKDEHPGVRANAAEALGAVGDPKAIDPLTEVVREDDDKSTRYYAARALGYIGDTRAVDLLIDALEDEEGRVRHNSAEALGNLHETWEIGAVAAVVPLIDALKDEDEWVRVSAAYSLGKIGDERATDPLIEVMEEDVHTGVQGWAAYALGMIGDRSAIEPLRAARGNENEWVRNMATDALTLIQAE